jgi:hypothetical protein
MTKRLVIIGGGAAGIFCAVNAARLSPELEVTVIEKTSKLLSKVRISGGGRCNVTHACFSVSELIKKYPRGSQFLKKSFQHFFTKDTIAWFEERGVKLKTEPDGRMFPATDSSETIIQCLLQEADKYKINIRLNSQFPENQPDIFEYFQADFICIACGGYPKSAQFEWIRNLGHTIQEPVPSLFTFNIPDHSITAIPGISAEIGIKIAGSKLNETGAGLVTHWGLSGPAVLRVSAWGARELAQRDYQFQILVNWLAGENENQVREKWQNLRKELASQKIKNRNPFNLPQRLWDYLLESAGINPEIRWADLPAKEQNRLINNLCSQELSVAGKTTFKEEFVTAGGVSLSEINPDTMESKIVPNLYFAGEVMDVDGITGGFNFQHAWTSGFIAARSIAGKVGT